MFQSKFANKIKTHILHSITFAEDRAVYAGKCCRTKQAADDNKVRRMRIACWITSATDTYSE